MIQNRFQFCQKFLNLLQKNQFSRRQGEKLSFKDKKLKAQTSKFQEMIKTQQEKQKEELEEFSDEYKEKFTPEQIMAKQHLSPIQLPEILQKRAQQVFSKYHTKDIREMGQQFIRMYQQLHATEKPQDILALKPFASTRDLSEQDQIDTSRIVLRNPNMSAQEAEIQAEKKRKEKIQKRKENIDKKQEEYSQINKTNEEQIKLENQSNPNKQLLQYTQNMAVAYLLRKMPHSYAIQKRIVNEIRRRLPLFDPKSLLDYGAGLGHSGHLFLEYYPELKQTVFLEPATIMRKLGKHITQDLEDPLWIDNLQRLGTLHKIEKFDVVLCSLVLEEVTSPFAREMIVNQLWNKVNENGILIVIEPGSPMGSRFVHDVRQTILKQKKDDEPRIVAPCPHNEQCPLAQNSNTWCHFSQKVQSYPKNIFPKKPNEKQQMNEKFSYIVFHKGKYNFDPLAENASPSEQSFDWNRILFPQIKKGGHIMVDLCTNDGEFERRTIAKSHKEFGKNGYKELKKLAWGDFWRFEKRIPNKYRKEGPKSKRLW